MRRIAFYGLCIVLILVNVSCREGGGQSAENPASRSARIQNEPFRIGVLLPSLHNDKAFSQSMFDSLTKLQKNMGADNLEFAVTENVLRGCCKNRTVPISRG